MNKTFPYRININFTLIESIKMISHENEHAFIKRINGEQFKGLLQSIEKYMRTNENIFIIESNM